MDDWQLFSDPRFALRFKCPELTIDGELVDRLEAQQTGIIRIHILAPRSRQVYFEVSKYDRLTTVDEYRQHTESLSTRFDPLIISELQEAQGAIPPARTYSYEWDQGRRVVLLAEGADAL